MSIVLNTGVYPPLLETRRLILEGAGHVVITTAEDDGIVQACKDYPFDIAVIGQSAAPPVKRRISRLIRRYCKSTKILELTTPESGMALEDADSWLEIYPGQAVAALLERLTMLAG
jgi:hypothetical protein